MLQDNMPKPRTIILASASPRRKELFAITGLKFKVDASEVAEDLGLRLSPPALARRLSREKARAVAGKYRNAVIIAADTFIVMGDKLLGKPHTEKEAIRMLETLNGKAHAVITGYTVLDTASGKITSRSVKTKVQFRKKTFSELRSYVKTREPLDKAGAYAIQGIGSLFVKSIEGDYFNVIGLPLASLAETLNKFGISILSS